MRKRLLSLLVFLFIIPAATVWAEDFWIGSVGSEQPVMTFDWSSSGTGVIEGAANPIQVGDILTFRYQGYLVRFGDPTGQTLESAGVNSEYEYTLVAQFDEEVTHIIEPGPIAFFKTLEGGKFFIYYDEDLNAHVNSGAGFDDGILIASGTIRPDQISYFMLTGTNQGNGSSITYGDVTYINPAHINPASLIVGWRFEGLQNLPALESTTAAMFISPDGEGNLDEYLVTTDDLILKVDGSSKFIVKEEDEKIGCRVTGGGHSTSGLDVDGVSWDGTLAEVKPTGNSLWYNTYQFGGQAGANTAKQPQPKGEWTHHQQKGPDGSFIFHAGTASAPMGTEIAMIECSDPGNCLPARPAPAKQIDFNGVGTFKNIRNASPSLANVIAGVTYHYFEVHIEDLGEPGKNGKQPGVNDVLCPPEGSPGEVANCGCPDFYRITIYAGVIPVFDPATGEILNLNTTDVIYDVYGYLSGGNLQIHPPTGFDLQ